MPKNTHTGLTHLQLTHFGHLGFATFYENGRR